MKFETNKKHDKKTLEKYVKEWTTKVFGADFQFREYQYDCVVNTLVSWFNGADNMVMEAPTGAGKSITAMIIAGVLSEYYDMRGYILISDLSLLEQYAADIKRYLPEWAAIRGQQTYSCIENGMPFPSGKCKLMGYSSYAQIEAHFSECSQYCEYICERRKAMTAPVVVCTYHFWLAEQNFVNARLQNISESDRPFIAGAFTICDEAHKILDIVQSYFSPEIKESDLINIANIFDRVHDGKTLRGLKPGLLKDVDRVRGDMFRRDLNDNEIFNLICEWHEILKILNDRTSECMREVAKTDKNNLSKEDKAFLRAQGWISHVASSFGEYINAIEKIGSEYIVRNDDYAKRSIIFNCINESYLMNGHFHRFCDKRLYMSATIGDPVRYADSISAKNAQHIVLPSTFNYANSPIYVVPGYDMSMNKKEANFPIMGEMVTDIARMFANMRGIIQTGSYEFAKRLYELVPDEVKDRMLLYSDSTEKKDIIELYRFSDNKILVGPTLVEGISFNDDMCRFQIILKVPYPSLGDKFVSKKKDIVPGWYACEAATKIIQGVGRGVRSKEDWCYTFIIDGCFGRILNDVAAGRMFNDTFRNRVRFIFPNNLKITQ